ncbi:hypothetical protein [Pseudofrankia asymbiotica]|uniref:hypothetical protein n=1 Tax=Pseudofrankia asymbiotica TaxID=1834516 RepID=UPI0010569E34|nr:hypothetical protein [Pseudofrankia asymbiotica]
MDFEVAGAELAGFPGRRPPVPGRPVEPRLAHFVSGMSIGIYPERGRVKAVEIFRPEENGDTIIFREMEVLALPAEQVISSLASLTRLDFVNGGLTVVAPELLLAFGRSSVSETSENEVERFFDSVLVAAPGYYDGPDGRPIYL